MSRVIGLSVLLIALLLCLSAIGCDSASSEDIADSLEDRLTDALDFDGGENADGVPDPGDGSGAAPQIDEWEVPETLRLGQPFVVTISTNFESSGGTLTTAVYVKGAKNHLHVRRDLGIQPDGRKRMSLYGVLAVDENLRGKTFNLELSLKTEDGVIGLPVPWPLKIEDEDPVALDGEPIEMLTMIGEDWIASGRPDGDPSADAPQILRIDGPFEFPIAVATLAGPVSDNVNDFNRIAAVLLSTPGNAGYKRSTAIQPQNLDDGLALRVELKLKPEVPDGTPLVFLFALEDVDGRVGLFQPYSIVATERVEVDGDPDPDGDDDVIVIDGDAVDGDVIDGDTDGDADDDADEDISDGDVVCLCETTDACCDGCQPINNGGECVPLAENAWTGYCEEGVCQALTYQINTLREDSNLERVALSADGTRLAAGMLSVIEIFDTETWQTVQTVPNSGEISIASLAFSPDGQYLAIASTSQVVPMFDTLGDEISYELSFDGINVTHLTFSADGSVLWAAGIATGGNLAATRLRDKTRIWTSATNYGIIRSIERIGMGIKVSLNNSQMLEYADLLVRGSVDGPSSFENGIVDQAISPLGNESAVLFCNTLNEDLQTCKEFGLSRFDIFNNAASDGEIFTLGGPLALAWSPDGATFAVAYCNRYSTGSMACESSQVILIDASTWDVRATLPEMPGIAQDVMFDRNTQRVFAFTQQAQVYVYELGPFGPPFTYECAETPTSCAEGKVCDLYAHRCRTNPCADGTDNDSDGMTDEADFDCSLGGFLELDVD